MGIFNRNNKDGLPPAIQQAADQLAYTGEDELSMNLDDNIAAIMRIFSNCVDINITKVCLFGSIPVTMVYLEILVDSKQVDEYLLTPLLNPELENDDSAGSPIDRIQRQLLPVTKTSVVSKMQDAVESIVRGEVVLFVDAAQSALSVIMRDPLHRALEEPNMEAVIRGPRIGFIETLKINMALLRQRIRSPRLKIEKLTAGSISNTQIAITYIEGAASQKVIDNIKKRISEIKMDSVMESGYVQEWITGSNYSPFPTIQATQRPDTLAAAMIEGRVGILVDGSPMALIAPVTFWYGFQTVEDYYMKYIFASFLRWLRYLFGFMALALPSIYVAVTTFHQEMVPTSLTLSLAAAREVVPFPAILETLIMEVTFEALREAGVRLPRPVGQTISIVGALVIGQAAVQAGIISAPIIIIVSLTGIASFLIPHPEMSQAFGILRFPMILSAGTFGLYGVGAFLLAILIHVVNLRSFGELYMSPVAPIKWSALQDVWVRSPWRMMSKRHE